MEVATAVFNLPNRFQIVASSLTPSLCRITTKNLLFFAPESFKSSHAWAIFNKKSISASFYVKRRRTLCGYGVNCRKTDIENGKCGKEEFIVVNFYRFVHIEQPQEEVAKHHSFLQGRDIRGRIYVNEQGINAQYSGPSRDALAYVDWLKEDDRFSDILVQITPASSGHAFPCLKLRYKPSLMEGGISHLPILDPEMRALPLDPSEWKERLQMARHSSSSDEIISSAQARQILLLDVRNGYEWDIGHFCGAQRPSVDCFRNTSFGLSDSECDCSDPLSNVDKETTDIMMYCTGGIRCDVYSTLLRQRGFQNLYTLKGGISHFLEQEGPGEDWEGNLFVFDSRLALQPSTFKPDANTHEKQKGNGLTHKLTSARCYLCGSSLLELRHRNCANLDCNFLFLCCNNCVEEFRGCCSSECTSAPRLRPVLPGQQRYEKWHVYRDSKMTDTQTV
ncbi:Rhodanese-like domain-containing protein 8 [Nymphaea thermarum]|nr:Rhodanese-like domain-containing protein 8 [Nymphaea thermarum]